jgi:hypothetical protein
MGKRTIGRRAVTGMGIASVIHQIAINDATAAVRVTDGFPGERLKKKRIAKATTGPEIRPIICLVLLLLVLLFNFCKNVVNFKNL